MRWVESNTGCLYSKCCTTEQNLLPTPLFFSVSFMVHKGLVCYSVVKGRALCACTDNVLKLHPAPLLWFLCFIPEVVYQCFLLFTPYIWFYIICYLSLEDLFLSTIYSFRKSMQWGCNSRIVWHVQGGRVDC